VVREVREECGLQVRVLGLCGVVDRIFRDEAGPGAASRVRYHWVILDYAAEVLAGTLRAGSDAAEARWVPLGDLGRYDLVAGIAEMVDRAVALRRAEAPAGGGSGS
jgi:ADP-ribose pyrophosphatase YjhB (NUDIX family)